MLFLLLFAGREPEEVVRERWCAGCCAGGGERALEAVSAVVAIAIGGFRDAPCVFASSSDLLLLRCPLWMNEMNAVSVLVEHVG